MINWGTVPLGAVLPFPFATYGKTNGESITLTGLAVTDIEVYKGATITQRASDAGYALIDTDGIDIDTITGIHGFTIDTGDNTDAGFFVAGSFYYVVVSAVTVDAQTVNFIAGTFSLRATESVAGVMEVDVTHFGGTALTAAAGIPEVKVASIANNAVTAAAIATDAIDADAIADNAINAAAIAADAITAAKLAADVTTELQSGLATAAALTTVEGKVDTVDTVVDAIKAKTDSLTFTVAGEVNANARYIDGDADAGDRLRRGTLGTTLGTCAALGTTTSVIASSLAPASAVNDQWNGKVMTFDMNTTTTALRGQSTTINDYDHATLTFTVVALTTAPDSGDTFTIS